MCNRTLNASKSNYDNQNQDVLAKRKYDNHSIYSHNKQRCDNYDRDFYDSHEFRSRSRIHRD
jgi:hypothetical protein